jgi:hypothetical protein
MNDDLIKFYLPTDEEQLEVAKYLFEKLSYMGVINYPVYEVLEESINRGDFYKYSDNYLSSDHSYLKGCWRFGIMVDRDDVKAIKNLSDTIICYIAQQILLTSKSDIKRVFKFQSLYVVDNFTPDNKVWLECVLDRIKPI